MYVFCLHVLMLTMCLPFAHLLAQKVLTVIFSFFSTYFLQHSCLVSCLSSMQRLPSSSEAPPWPLSSSLMLMGEQ